MYTTAVPSGQWADKSPYISHQFPPYEPKNNEESAKTQDTAFQRNAPNVLYWLFFHCFWNHLADDMIMEQS